MIDMTKVAEAREKAEMARKAAKEGRHSLAASFYEQAADRYKAAGMPLVAENCLKMAR